MSPSRKARTKAPLPPTLLEDAFEERRTLGQTVSDNLASFGGSWTFIFLFLGTMVAWITVNAVSVFQTGFDPYPFILLNLVLSCLAALQAPIIMMSQNRQESKDRLRSENDYRVNVKAEAEIELLHQKLDEVLTRLKSLESKGRRR